jgi:hypothetical protein
VRGNPRNGLVVGFDSEALVFNLVGTHRKMIFAYQTSKNDV